MSSTAPRITDAEWELMEGVWRQAGQTAGEILARLETQGRSHRTLRTLLARLVDKGAVLVTVEGSRYLYSAAVSREACVRNAARSFSERFFAGDLQSLLLHFVETEELSDSEVEELKQRLASRLENSGQASNDRKTKSPKSRRR